MTLSTSHNPASESAPLPPTGHLAMSETRPAELSAEERAKTIVISVSAAEAIEGQRQKRGTPDAAIRVGIRGGGCTGFSYLFEWDDNEPRKTDKVFYKDGVKLYVDPKSFVYLRGTELDFIKSMMGHGFKFINPNVKGECGCGESVQF